MTTSNPNRITWLQFAAVWGICTVAGSAVGVCTSLLTDFDGVPWQERLFYTPFIVVFATTVAGVWAVVASLVRAIGLLLMQRHMRGASPTIWRLAGGGVGAFVGALPLLYLAIALTLDGQTIDYVEARLQLVLFAGSGMLSGVLVAWWYRTKVLRGVDAEKGVLP
jgi:hypothetical protein